MVKELMERGMADEGSGFRAPLKGYRDHIGFRVRDAKFWGQGFGFGVQGLEFRFQGLGFRV